MQTSRGIISLSIVAVSDIKQLLNNTTFWNLLAILLLIIFIAGFSIPLSFLWVMMLNPSKNLYDTLQ